MEVILLLAEEFLSLLRCEMKLFLSAVPTFLMLLNVRHLISLLSLLLMLISGSQIVVSQAFVSGRHHNILVSQRTLSIGSFHLFGSNFHPLICRRILPFLNLLGHSQQILILNRRINYLWIDKLLRIIRIIPMAPLS